MASLCIYPSCLDQKASICSAHFQKLCSISHIEMLFTQGNLEMKISIKIVTSFFFLLGFIHRFVNSLQILGNKVWIAINIYIYIYDVRMMGYYCKLPSVIIILLSNFASQYCISRQLLFKY